MTQPLSDAQKAVIAANLADANKQYHALLTGTMARVIVDQNGERVEFTAAKASDLYAYIQQLNGLLCPTPAAFRGPLGFIF